MNICTHISRTCACVPICVQCVSHSVYVQYLHSLPTHIPLSGALVARRASMTATGRHLHRRMYTNIHIIFVRCPAVPFCPDTVQTGTLFDLQYFADGSRWLADIKFFSMVFVKQFEILRTGALSDVNSYDAEFEHEQKYIVLGGHHFGNHAGFGETFATVGGYLKQVANR